ncbi:MAG: hypothetical protein N2593_02760 [Patescibacteria group bacterium]|nr:hypothetical protein [Patescibacteria group bacterium]MCX7955996.1 hypothetical protein [Patescibacteria group bacterium]
MKNLEKKIIKNIYKIEFKKTIFEIIIKGLIFIFLFFSLFIFSSIVFEIIKEERLTDFFQIFFEDKEVWKKYFFDSFYIFYLQIPKVYLGLFFLFLFLFFGFFLYVLKNFYRLKNKIISFLKFIKKI